MRDYIKTHIREVRKDWGFIAEDAKPFRVPALIVLALIALSMVNCHGPERSSTGIVTGKAFQRQYVSTTFIQSGTVLTPITTVVPDRWTITCNTGVDGEQSQHVTQEEYDSVKIGDRYEITWRARRWF